MSDTNSPINDDADREHALLLKSFKTLEEMIKIQRSCFEDLEKRFVNIEQYMLTRNESLTQCPERYQGDYDADLIMRFINNTEMYKYSRKISDQRSLQDLPHLLVGHAYDWWQTQKDNIKTWTEAMEKLRKHFSSVLPDQTVYDEFFRKPYSDVQTFEAFIIEKKLLLARWPNRKLSKCEQLNMMYSLLPTEMREKIPRNEINTMTDLEMKIKNINLVNYNTNKNTSNTPNVNGERSMASEVETCSTTAESVSTNKCEKANSNEQTESVQVVKQERIEPIIKVRRLEDLMRLPNKDECCITVLDNESNLDQQKESVAQESTEAELQIDSDIMKQINDVIHDYNAGATFNYEPEANVESEIIGSYNMPATAKVAGKGSQKKGQKKVPLKKQSKRLRVHCSFCRVNGHLSFDCKKKTKCPQTDIQECNLTESNSCDSTAAAITAPDKQSVQAEPHFKAPAPAFSTIESYVERTAMIVIPAKGRSATRSATAKSKAASSPSSKCHQCGTVGYYRSICPNCSPIYLHKPQGGNKR